MNPFDRMHTFVRVAELASFTQAAEALGIPKASASTAVQQLETQLGTRLLHRTTRRVQLTQDGQAYYERCKDLLADVDELQSMFQHADGEGAGAAACAGACASTCPPAWRATWSCRACPNCWPATRGWRWN